MIDPSVLPPDERCCVEALADRGIPSVMKAFVVHCMQHGLGADRQAELWTCELLVQAAFGFRLAAGACVDGRDDPEEFAAAARRAWHEAVERRREAVRVRQ